MIIRGLIFDINGTLTDILTNEWHDDIYRILSNLLSYQGIALDPNKVKDSYFQIMKEQRAARDERYPEFDAVGIFREIITRHATDFTRRLPPEMRRRSTGRSLSPRAVRQGLSIFSAHAVVPSIRRRRARLQATRA